MKVLLVNNHFSNTGGADVYTYRLGKLLLDKGHQVFYFATDKKPYFEEDYPYAKFFPKYTDLFSMPKNQLLKYGFKSFYSFEAGEKISMLLEEIRPDIVHINCIFYKLTPSVLIPCYKRNIPVVMTLHGPQMMCPSIKMMKESKYYCNEGHCIGGNPWGCIKYKCADNSLIKSIGMVGEYLFRNTLGFYNNIAYFICPSNAVAELAERSGIKSSKLRVINNFIPQDAFDREPKYTNNGYFLFVGRLFKEKGAHYLIEAMRKLPEDLVLHIAGDGVEEENLRNQALEYGLENINFKGFLTGKELEEEYKNCIATILPCNWFENFPTTVLESFTYGKPSLASNIGGIPEIIEDGVNGFLFEPGNSDQIAECILKFYENRDFAVQAGKNARIKAEKLYTPEKYYEKLMEIYKL